MVGADGLRVKPGLLLRSGTLGFGSHADISRLRDEYDLRLVVDFRNLIELSEFPDPMERIPAARYLHAEIFSDHQVGVTQEHEKTEFEYKLEAMAQGDPTEFMTLLYPHMLTDETGINGYRAFVRAVLDVEEGAALWHCYVGRDRCGMGSVLVETMLGVSAMTSSTTTSPPTSTRPSSSRWTPPRRDAISRRSSGLSSRLAALRATSPGPSASARMKSPRSASVVSSSNPWVCTAMLD